MSRIGPEDVNNKQEPPFLRRLLFFVRTETPQAGVVVLRRAKKAAPEGPCFL